MKLSDIILLAGWIRDPEGMTKISVRAIVFFFVIASIFFLIEDLKKGKFWAICVLIIYSILAVLYIVQYIQLFKTNIRKSREYFKNKKKDDIAK